MNARRTLFLAISLCFAVQLPAQFNKGTLQFGVDAVTDVALGDGFPIEFRTLTPEVSYFFSDRVSVGLSGRYSQIRGLNEGGLVEFTNYNIGVLPKYYFFREDRFYSNVEAYVGVGETLFNSFFDDTLDDRFTRLRLGLGVGMGYYILPKVALSFSTRYDREYTLGRNTPLFDSDLNVRFGLRVDVDTRE